MSENINQIVKSFYTRIWRIRHLKKAKVDDQDLVKRSLNHQRIPWTSDDWAILPNWTDKYVNDANVDHFHYVLNTRPQYIIIYSQSNRPTRSRVCKEPVSYTHLTLPTTPYV